MDGGTRPDEEVKNKQELAIGDPIQIEDVTPTPTIQDEFSRLEREASEQLLYLKTSIPFDLWPDEVSIDRQMIVVKRNVFWGLSHTVSSHLTDILNSHLNKGPIFGSVLINTQYLTENEFAINWLSREDAEKLHEFLQGLLIARKEGLDLSKASKEELRDKLLTLGNRAVQIAN